jgi:hypothetical protein
MASPSIFRNPYRPGAGHAPPYLAGRDAETFIFAELLEQNVISSNLVLTGLRGMGKTVLLESFKPIAYSRGWLWAGADCSESASAEEESLALRVVTDLSLITSGIKLNEAMRQEVGFFAKSSLEATYMDFEYLVSMYNNVPGLPSDKLKAVLLHVWQQLSQRDGVHGIVMAYDEVQTLGDHPNARQYPLSLLLDVFQSLQRAGACYLLVLTGLPLLLTRLVEARTFSERMFRVLALGRLTEKESREAILVPLRAAACPVRFDEPVVEQIVRESGGFPYFVQYICKDTYDAFLQQMASSIEPVVPIEAITSKLDNDFFASRWSQATEREKELLTIVAQNGLEVFTLKQLAALSESSDFKPFGTSQASHLLKNLIENGLVYKTRRGEYALAVPLLASYIIRSLAATRLR